VRAVSRLYELYPGICLTTEENLSQGKVHPITGHEGSEGKNMYSSTLPSTSVIDGVGGKHHAPAALPPGNVQEVGWTPGPVWMGAVNLASTGIRSPDRPARSESLEPSVPVIGLSRGMFDLCFSQTLCPVFW
jgi:hypothetical protein